MAVTITKTNASVGTNKHGQKKINGTFACSGTYATGGTAIDWSSDFGTLEHLSVSPASGYVPEWDYTNSKLMIRQSAATATVLGEVANTSVVAVTFRFTAEGRIPTT